jgi:hypothetical protein
MSQINQDETLVAWRDAFVDELGYQPTYEELLEFIGAFDIDPSEPNESEE